MFGCANRTKKYGIYNIEEEDIKNMINNIQNFGKITGFVEIKYKFKKCPNNIKEQRKYCVTGNNENILTKTGLDNSWAGTICEDSLDEIKEYKWKIKILNSKYKNIMVGVASSDFDINSSLYNTHGWYLY